MRGIYLEYSRHKLEMTRKEYVRHILDIWYRKWVDIYLVYVGIFQTYRPNGQIYGIFQEYVRISNFYGLNVGFQIKGSSSFDLYASVVVIFNLSSPLTLTRAACFGVAEFHICLDSSTS